MGACLGTPGPHGGGSGGGGRRRTSTLSGEDESTSSAAVHAAKNKPLRPEKVRWRSEVPLTEGQLKTKRDEFWDTAPAFEGKKEIWMALRAAVEATGEDDFALAQALIDGAGISLPHGSLAESYDELGTRYTIPIYCLSKPVNLTDGEDERDSPAEFSEPVPSSSGGPPPPPGLVPSDIKLRVRVSLTAADVRMVVSTAETVGEAKRRLHAQEHGAVAKPEFQRWFYGGKMLTDRTRFADTSLASGNVVQCIVNKLDMDVVEGKK